MPRIAFKIQTPLLTNCVDIEVRPDGKLFFIKPVHKNRFHARICTTSQSSTLATLLPKALQDTKQSKKENTSLEIFQVDRQQLNLSDAIEVIGFIKADHRTIDITEAETIVAVGRGVGSEENYKMIKVFADRIGGALAGTRPAVDMGRMPYERQIGQTGKRVSPKLLFLLGISGATEFTKGIDGAGTVVAVNKDRHAQVFNMADLGIVADLENITPKFLDHINDLCDSSDRSNVNADTYD
jgi:electron transfer flavoprotein alpha subunit